MQESHIREYTLQFINQTQRSIFLTGKRVPEEPRCCEKLSRPRIRIPLWSRPEELPLNAGGVTIHSMFQLPFGGFIPAFNVESQFTETVKFESKDTLEAFQNGRPQNQ
jgi:hypothetical protein